MRGQPLAVLILIASMAGFGFAAVSTYDSVNHLDRQVHGIHCSYFLGAGKEDVTGSSGCYATLMSPYSSVFRESIWGGIPMALAGMSVFGFLVFWTLFMMVRRRLSDPRAAGFLFAATLVPTLTSIVMGYISIVDLNTVCKMCMGIYVASGVAFLAAGVLFYFAIKFRDYPIEMTESDSESVPGASISWGTLVGAFGLGVGFVVLPVGTYAAMAPDFSHYAGSCGALTTFEDADRVLIPLGPQNREIEMIEVMDPLCVACGLFERRFSSMEESEQVRRKVMLFPLDNACNWMVDDALHPGSCAVSEAIICANDRAEAVMSWAIDHHEEISERAKQNPEVVAGMVGAQFPELKNCIGSAAVRAKLNLALRWTVKNQLQVLTPQIFVQGRRLCDEDTDLGLEYALTRLIARAKTGAPLPTLTAVPEEKKLPAVPGQRPARKKKELIRLGPKRAPTDTETEAPEPKPDGELALPEPTAGAEEGGEAKAPADAPEPAEAEPDKKSPDGPAAGQPAAETPSPEGKPVAADPGPKPLPSKPAVEAEAPAPKEAP